MRPSKFCNGCTDKHCCFTCDNYGGSIEFAPSIHTITCKSPANEGKAVGLTVGGYPTIDKVVVKTCENWS